MKQHEIKTRLHKRLPISLWARDRRLAAVHEAGHVAIARMLGVPVGLAYVYFTPARDFDPPHCRTWRGKTLCASRLADRRQRAMIGVAGAVAELSWRGEWIDEDYWFEPTMMSDSDWNLTQCVASKPDDNCIEATAGQESADRKVEHIGAPGCG